MDTYESWQLEIMINNKSKKIRRQSIILISLGSLALVINLIFFVRQRDKAHEIVSSMKEQQESLLKLHRDVSLSRNRDRGLSLSELEILNPLDFIEDSFFCSQNREDNQIIVFFQGNYAVVKAKGAKPFHISDFNYWIVEEGIIQNGSKVIILRNKLGPHEAKSVYIIKEVTSHTSHKMKIEMPVLFNYGEILMPKKYCNELQRHAYKVVKKRLKNHKE